MYRIDPGMRMIDIVLVGDDSVMIRLVVSEEGHPGGHTEGSPDYSVPDCVHGVLIVPSVCLQFLDYGFLGGLQGETFRIVSAIYHHNYFLKVRSR